ncbi:MAG: hypothetical protein HY271_07670 [Deltaproteobacteria bacterium]|nr:hypothetical protein [Deltaproteobacteria bacterium]
MLRSLLERHPDLVPEVEELAQAVVTDVDAEAIADEVEHAVLDLDLEDLNARAGRTSWGYIEPTEAAWELLGEALDPFLGDMKRHIELGFEPAAVGACQGIVLGLYRCRDKASDGVFGWAEDFPAETAGHAVATLARGGAAKHRRRWRLPRVFVDQVPDWADLIERAARR